MSLDKWIPELKRKTEQKEKQPNYKLPLGSVSVYFDEDKGRFIIKYDRNSNLPSLITNLSVLSKIWSKLIQLNLSPRCLSKAYDDLFATVIDVINNEEAEEWEEIEIDGFKVKVLKHKIGSKLLDLSIFSPKVPYYVIQEMNKRGIYFENPMPQYRLALEKRGERYGENYITYSAAKETKTYKCELCGVKTTKLHRLRTGQLQEYFPDKKVCLDCYLREDRRLYEEYDRCPECHTRIKLDKWPNFICENGHINNVNFIEFDAKSLLNDVYGKIPEEDYKKLHDRYRGDDYG